SLELGGPYAVTARPPGKIQKEISACKQLQSHHARSCGRAIVANVARRAYRRPVTTKEIAELSSLIDDVQKDGGTFEEGVATAIQATLLSPQFLFRIEGTGTPSTRSLSQYELASRLSYFLWSSMPDDALLAAADRGTLTRPATLQAQVRRMLRDPKSRALI